MKEKKEFPKGEFLGFRCVLECSETECVFSPQLDSLFIVAGVNLDLRTCAQRALLAQRECLYAHLVRATCLVQVFVFALSVPLPH